MLKYLLILLLACPTLAQDLESLLTDQDAFCARELKSGRHWEVHPELCERGELPASTFKIPNTLIALDTGAIANPGVVLKWDGKWREIEAWNKDHHLRSAYHNSVVWYYQEIARRVGSERMQSYLDRFEYGNRNMQGGLDHFWLDGRLRISALEQLDFLEGVQSQRFELKPATYGMGRAIMETETINGQTLFAKTGWARLPDSNVGWYVGWVEGPKDAIVFAYNCRRGVPAPPGFAENRLKSTRACLNRLGWLLPE